MARPATTPGSQRLPWVIWTFLVIGLALSYAALIREASDANDATLFLAGFLTLYASVFAFGLWLVRGESGKRATVLLVGMALISLVGLVALWRQAAAADRAGDQFATVLAGIALLVALLFEKLPATNPRGNH